MDLENVRNPRRYHRKCQRANWSGRETGASPGAAAFLILRPRRRVLAVVFPVGGERKYSTLLVVALVFSAAPRPVSLLRGVYDRKTSRDRLLGPDTYFETRESRLNARALKRPAPRDQRTINRLILGYA